MLYIIFTIAAACLIFFLRKKGEHKTELAKTTHISDPHAQELYDKEKYPEVNIPAQERIEMSWQFLYSITETVNVNFSLEDKDVVHKLGQVLNSHNMQYHHVVDAVVKHNLKRSPTNKEREVSSNL